ncbi:unnamed protein product [Bemisia tabaci]|nr:PREDICTED: ankyrin-3 isoform X2 [Bemisia tabaci]XP_018909805.1 PREDICTED: ankyrin-3 isoform X2 [Bemisia tabaci]CAH0387034.1 unnamed protein product [Bemisia tabaci]
MGGALSHFFQSGSALLSANHRGCSDQTRSKIRVVFDALRANPRVTCQRLQGLLSQIPKNENILLVHDEEGYNLLQKCVGLNNVDMVRWILSRNVDLNRGACSFPLHIACLKGYLECVELLLKHGSRVDVEARMCWPHSHSPNCEERGKQCEDVYVNDRLNAERGKDKVQNAICYAVDGDQANVLECLMQQNEGEHWLPWQQKRPLLHLAVAGGAWECVKLLVTVRSDEIGKCVDEYYPLHHAVLKPLKFLALLSSNGADLTVVTPTQQMNALHLVFLLGRKSAEDTLATCKLLLESGLQKQINEPDSLGNTPLHGLIVRYAIEEARIAYDTEIPWNKWDVLHLMRFLLSKGAQPSINQPGNSALACVLRHVKDWEFRYELLNMLLQEGGNPNNVGRDGSVPLMVCLVPLINKDPLHHLTHTMKVCYQNCVRILCKHGANPNCTTRSNLTPLHVLVFSANENMENGRGSDENESKTVQNMEFIRSLLAILLQHGLDPNIRFSPRTQHILQSILDMIQASRQPSELQLQEVYRLTLIFLQYGANPDLRIPLLDPGCHNSATANVLLRTLRGNHYVLFYYVTLILRKEELLHKSSATFASIIWLYYFSMSHRELYDCLGGLLKAFEAGVLPMRATALVNLLKELYTRPRSLKQIARHHVYKSLGRKPAMHVNKLPLPNALKEYILNFEF